MTDDQSALSQDEIRIPLMREFRYIHEPVRERIHSQFVGRTSELNELSQRILFSDGGSFLVTGYRGVGKTSFVNEVAAHIREHSAWTTTVLGPTEVLHVELNLARALTPQELMYHILERLYETLEEANILQALPPTLRSRLELAYARTSVTLSHKIANTLERTSSLPEWEFGAAPVKASVKGYSRKSSHTENDDRTFLAYDERSAEHDLIRVTRWLSDGFEPNAYTIRSRIATGISRWLLRRKPQHRRLKILFVFDELDKLDDPVAQSKDGSEVTTNVATELGSTPPSTIDVLLNALKPLFTTSGISFVFVAGRDLYDRWSEDVARGDSVYESVFSYDKYIPLMWPDTGALFDRYLAKGDAGLTSDQTGVTFNLFKDYVTYLGRGIPRRMIRAFNEFVRWEITGPKLTLDQHSLRRVRLYAGLQQTLSSHEKQLFGTLYEEARGTLEDRRRLGVYYLVDWMLHRGTLSFSYADAVNASRSLSNRIALGAEIAPSLVTDLLKILRADEYIEIVDHLSVTWPPSGVTDATSVLFRIHRRRLGELSGTDGAAEIESAADSSTSKSILDGRFALNVLIGQGGMSTVYSAVDLVSGETVVVKQLGPLMLENAESRRILEREVFLQRDLRHPGIVPVLYASLQAEHPFIVLEYVNGFDLAQLIQASRLSPVAACGIAQQVADAAGFIHEHGFAQLDLKPANLLVGRSDNRVRLADLGVAVPIGEPVSVGTRAYMAPETTLPSAIADPRSDIYSLGVVLHEMLLGVRPTPGTDFQALGLPDSVKEIVQKCLRTSPDERFQTMGALSLALANALPTLADFPASATGLTIEKVAKVAEYERIQTDPRLWNAASTSTDSSDDDQPVRISFPSELQSGPQNELAAYGGAASLTISDGSTTRTVTLPAHGEVSIGRGAGNEIVIPSRELSRRHARIRISGHEYIVEDLNTLNGTFVNEERLLVPRVLRNLDVIKLGGYELKFFRQPKSDDAGSE